MLEDSHATLQSRLQRTLRDIGSASQALGEICSEIRTKSDRDLTEKRNDRALYRAARAANKMSHALTETIAEMKLPTGDSYEELKSFENSLARIALEALRVRDEWRNAIRPYYILDMMSLGGSLEKLRRLAEELRALLLGDGRLLRQIDETKDKVERIKGLKASIREVSQAEATLSSRSRELERRITDLQATLDSMAQSAKMREYAQVEAALRDLRVRLISSGFRRLGRPLRKLQAAAERGESPLTPEQKEQLLSYLEKPAHTFMREDPGYPNLKALLLNLQRAMESGKLALKQREQRKILERIGQVVRADSLARFQDEAKELAARRTEMLRDPEVMELSTKVGDLRKKMETLLTQRREGKEKLQKMLDQKQAITGQLTRELEELKQLAQKLSGKDISALLD